MPITLTQDAVEQFHNDGYVSPVDIMPESEAAELRGRLEAFEATQGGKLDSIQRNKSHLLFKWLDDLIRDRRVLDPIEDLIGGDILCWNTLFWVKEPQTPAFVSWHQDVTYWGLDGGDVITAWLALSPATIESGCMRVLPGTHLGEVLPHEDRYDAANMLTRGQEISIPIDESKGVFMPLKAGQMSMHNIRLAHASTANQTDDRRIGVSMHFMPTQARQTMSDWDSAALVRGGDTFGHFEATPRPAIDFDSPAVAFHEKATAAVRRVLYHDASKNTERL